MDEEKKSETSEKVKENPVHEVKRDNITEEKKLKKDDTLTSKVRENPWVLATVVLAIVTIVLLVGDFSGMTGAAVGVAQQSDVESKILDFVKSQVDGNVSLVDTQMVSGLYEITISLDGQEIPIYVTADGVNLVQGVTPLDALIQGPQDTAQQQTPEPTQVPKSDKPEVELFVMSMCPYGTQAIKGILPVLELFGDKIDFSLRFVSYAMHGKNEIDENTVQYCIQKEQPEKFYAYLNCYLEEGTSEAWKACQSKVGINTAKLNPCITATDTEFKITELYNDKSSWSGGSYPQYNVDASLNTEYEVRGSPTLIINGVSSNAGRSSASYLAGVCAAFNEAPEECNTELSSASPSPGFGWEGSGSATTASCG